MQISGPDDASIPKIPCGFWGTGVKKRTIGDMNFEILDATAPAEEVVPHTHDDAHFIYVLKGHYVSSARRAPPIASMPVVIANPAGTHHRDHFSGPDGKFLAFSAPADRMADGPARLINDFYCMAAMHGLAKAISCGASDLEIDETGTVLLAATSANPKLSRHIPDWMEKAYQVLMDSEAGELNMTFLSQQVGAHPVHIARSFKRHIGKTASEILRARQVERSCGLLMDSEMSLASIACDLGYYDQAHFTHSFRRATGMTPRAWRNQYLRQVA